MRNHRAAAAVVAVLLATGLAVAFSAIGHHAPDSPSPMSRPPAVSGAHRAQPPLSPSAAADIYKLLPFSQAQLGTAIQASINAGSDYQTFSWKDSPQAYAARIAPWVSPQFDQALEHTFGNQTATDARGKAREVSTATAAVISIRTFGPTSITFIVTISQHDPVTDDSGNYAVTVATTDGKAWTVNDIEPAFAGNA